MQTDSSVRALHVDDSSDLLELTATYLGRESGQLNVVAVTVGSLDVSFYIEDDGTGIPEGSREEVFDAGYSTDADGTGFWLHAVEQIAREHG